MNYAKVLEQRLATVRNAQYCLLPTYCGYDLDRLTKIGKEIDDFNRSMRKTKHRLFRRKYLAFMRNMQNVRYPDAYRSPGEGAVKLRRSQQAMLRMKHQPEYADALSVLSVMNYVCFVMRYVLFENESGYQRLTSKEDVSQLLLQTTKKPYRGVIIPASTVEPVDSNPTIKGKEA